MVLLQKLGIDVHLFLAQAFNFFVVFGAIYFLVYKRLIAFMNKRRKFIADGVLAAEKAQRQLREAEAEKAKMIAHAQDEALIISSAITNKAQEKKKSILEKAHEQEARIMEKAQEEAHVIIAAGHAQARHDAVLMVKKILTDVIETSPTAVDAALIRKAAKAARIT